MDHSRVRATGCPGVLPGTSSPEGLDGLTEGNRDGGFGKWLGRSPCLAHEPLSQASGDSGNLGRASGGLAIWEGMAKTGITKNWGTAKGGIAHRGKGSSPDAWLQGEQVCALASNSGGKSYFLVLVKEREEF